VFKRLVLPRVVWETWFTPQGRGRRTEREQRGRVIRELQEENPSAAAEAHGCRLK
jgi:hypothetical protein